MHFPTVESVKFYDVQAETLHDPNALIIWHVNLGIWIVYFGLVFLDYFFFLVGCETVFFLFDHQVWFPELFSIFCHFYDLWNYLKFIFLQESWFLSLYNIFLSVFLWFLFLYFCLYLYLFFFLWRLFFLL